jgi:phosphohistidine phosphatase
MKRLWLLRHASAAAGSPDVARPLDARGREEAVVVAAQLTAAASQPELILSSTARRARETTDLLTEGLNSDPATRLDEALYLAAPGQILRSIAAIEPECAALLVVGHNPGFADLADDLAIGGGAAARRLRATGFPTCALAAFELDVDDWEEVDPTFARLVAFETPT